MSIEQPRFFSCQKCNVVIEEIKGGECHFNCGGSELPELHANTSDGASEKHLPVVARDGGKITVKVGSVFHPMSAEHSIEWVYLKTKRGSQRVNLKADEEPVATFLVAEGDTPLSAYAYCNLHGLWKTDI